VVVGADERERIVWTGRPPTITINTTTTSTTTASGSRVTVPVVVAVKVETGVVKEPGRRSVTAQRGVARAARVASSAVTDQSLLVGAQRQRRVHSAVTDVL